MDIHERQSDAPAESWKGFQFSTLVVCILGILGNVSSLVVLIRHLEEIAGFRLLVALAVADLGVVISVASHTLAIVTYNNWLTQVLDWWFLYCYYCSIYMTVLLSLDRYLHTALSMLLWKIDYHHLLKRAIVSVFVILLLITLPHFLGNFVHYQQGSNIARANRCPSREACNSTTIPTSRELGFCGPNRNATSLTQSELDVHKRLMEELCDMAKKHIFEKEACRAKTVSVSNSRPNSVLVWICYNIHDYAGTLQRADICKVGVSAMKCDPDFVKAVYLGIDLPLRYVIPCCLLAVINILLVRSVRKAQRRHRDISKTASTSLLNLPVLRSAVGIVFVLLICHTGAVGLFVLNVLRAFIKHNDGCIGTGVNVFIK